MNSLLPKISIYKILYTIKQTFTRYLAGNILTPSQRAARDWFFGWTELIFGEGEDAGTSFMAIKDQTAALGNDNFLSHEQSKAGTVRPDLSQKYRYIDLADS